MNKNVYLAKNTNWSFHILFYFGNTLLCFFDFSCVRSRDRPCVPSYTIYI